MNPNRPPHPPTSSGNYYSASSSTAVAGNNNVVGGGGGGSFQQQQQQNLHNRQGFPPGQQGRPNQNGPIVQNRQQRSVNNPNSNPNNIPSTMQQNRPPQPKKHPSSNQPYNPTPTHHNTTGSGYSTQAGHKATFGKKGQEVVVEQLSSKLGFPDVYLCEQNSIRPVMELSFTSSTAREGYVDKSFSYIDRESIDSHGTHFSNNDFYNLLEKSEQILREEHKTFSTNKTREEMKQRFENAVNSCGCTANNSFFPKLTDTGTTFKALAGRPDEQKRSSLASPRTSLRELSSKLSKYYVKPNFFELLAQNNIPFFRALWYTKILIRDINSNITNMKDLAQDLTAKFCDYLIASCNDDSSDPKKKNSIIYTINFLSYCLEENLLNENVLGQKLLEILESKFGIKPKASKDTPLMDAYFFSLLYVKTSDQIYQQLSSTIQASKKVGPVIKFYVLQLFKLFMMHSSDPKFTFEIYRRLNPGQQQLSLDSAKNLFCKIKDDIYAINVLDRHNCNIPELYHILMSNKEIGVQLIATICKWAITSKRFQNYRPYTAGTLVNNFIKQNPTMKKQIEDTLFKAVLNYSEEEPTPDSYKNLLKLFNELILQNNFSISEYIKYLTSRGFNVSKTDEFNTRHTNILKNLPSYDSTTKNKIYSKLYGTKHELHKKNQQTELELKENIFKIVNGGGDSNLSTIIETITNLPENGIQFEITQQVAEHVKSMDLAHLSEQTIDNILAIIISVSNFRAFRDIVYNITMKLISGEFKSPNLEIKMFSIIKNSLQLFISLDDSDIIDIFQKRFKTTNNRNIQSIIHRYITEISTTPNADPFKAKITKFTNDCNVIPAPINAESSSPHPFTQYIQSQDIILIPSNILVSELTKNPTKFSNDQLKHLIEVLFEKFQKHRVDTYITVLRDMYTFSNLLSDTSIIDSFKDFVISKLDSTQYSREKHSHLIIFCMKAVNCGVLSGYSFLNHILFNVFDSLKNKVATISKPNPQTPTIHTVQSSTKISIFQHVNFIRVFTNFSRCSSKDRITSLSNNCGLTEEAEAVDREIYEDVKTTLLYDFLGPVESKETIHKMSLSCKSINVKSSKNSTRDTFGTLVYEAMIEILLDYISNEKSLQDISRTLSYTQDCFGPLYELPSLQTKTTNPKEGDGANKSNSKDSDYGNKYQAITTLVASLCKPFSTIRDIVPEKLFSYLSQSTSIVDYLQFIISLSNQSDKWRITLDSQLLFLFMFTWNRRRSLTKDLYLPFIRKGQESSYYYAKSLLLTSFYPLFSSDLQDVILEQFKLSINDKNQQDIEAILPIVEELIRLDFSKAETACKYILDAIQSISNPSPSSTQSSTTTPSTPTPHSNPSTITRDRLTTCLLCLKDIIFSSPLLESHEDKFGERKRTTTVPQIKSILINLCTNKILPSVFNAPSQKPEDVTLYDIYYLIYGMLAKLKIPQEELNKEFEKLFLKENSQTPNPRSIQVGTPVVSTPTSSSTTRRTPTSASKMSPIVSPQQSPVPMSPQVVTVRPLEQNRVINSWFVIEDYVSNCSHCNSCHGNLTPARFVGSKVVKKTELIFAKKPSENPTQSTTIPSNHSDNNPKKRKSESPITLDNHINESSVEFPDSKKLKQ